MSRFVMDYVEFHSMHVFDLFLGAHFSGKYKHESMCQSHKYESNYSTIHNNHSYLQPYCYVHHNTHHPDHNTHSSHYR
jgi:hypothetical protein